MKTAIYIENGITQLVLTPETDWEKQVTNSIETGIQNVSIHRDSFYKCREGWTRFGGGDNDSLILRVSAKSEDKTLAQPQK